MRLATALLCLVCACVGACMLWVVATGRFSAAQETAGACGAIALCVVPLCIESALWRVVQAWRRVRR